MATYTFEKEKDMEIGFQDFHGNIWTDSEVFLYNTYTDIINKHAGIEIDTNSLRHKELEGFRDGRHNLFLMVNLMRKNGKQIGN